MSRAKIERNTSVGACAHKRLFRSIFILCVCSYGRTPGAAEVLYVFKTPIFAKKYKKMRFDYVEGLHFRRVSKIKKFSTKNPDLGIILY